MPQRLSYLKPSINASEQIDLGKLLGFAQDTNVKVIEIGGPNKNVFVSGVMGKKKTGVVLNKEEIEKIINNFLKLGTLGTLSLCQFLVGNRPWSFN